MTEGRGGVLLRSFQALTPCILVGGFHRYETSQCHGAVVHVCSLNHVER